MSVHRTDRAERHLWVFALIRSYLEKNQDKSLIEAFKKTTFRSYLSLLFDLSLDKKYGATKTYLKNVKTEWKEVKNLKKPLPEKGRSYCALLERTWLKSRKPLLICLRRSQGFLPQPLYNLRRGWLCLRRF